VTPAEKVALVVAAFLVTVPLILLWSGREEA
jgi:hypothetical protein